MNESTVIEDSVTATVSPAEATEVVEAPAEVVETEVEEVAAEVAA